MIFNRESDFEKALINLLVSRYGWCEVIENPSEADLIKNWSEILYRNNIESSRLNACPLTKGEMDQILQQIENAKTPNDKNEFINGVTVSIVRDNKDDQLNLGTTISLRIFNRKEVAGGKSHYQIARQPRFTRKVYEQSDRRGDLMLLINGLPVIHVELKKSNIGVNVAVNQIERYMKQGAFSGLFSLVQIFVAMNPDDCVYFANPGEDGVFNKDYQFRWADFNNKPVIEWDEIAKRFLSIPMAHQLIGFYTIADTNDGILKVLRSYQYHAISSIQRSVREAKWNDVGQRGGYIWHTTGSGKTMTSFKAAHLLATSGDADKVVFLMDRIELGNQSLLEYQGFAGDMINVVGTENTSVLIDKLKSKNTSDKLIVTSIQKMSRIKEDGRNQFDVNEINANRIIVIVDEAHRSTFGDMLITIKQTFPNALFFGFTGTPIHDDNMIKDNTTVDVFGDELHRYTIVHGIRDKNVLGFDLYGVPTFSDRIIRQQIAFHQSKAEGKNKNEKVKNVFEDEMKKKIYLKFMYDVDVKMAGYEDKNKYIKGIEDYIPASQYQEKHRRKVVKDILDNWYQFSCSGMFHAILATSSIPEAIEYYRLLKNNPLDLKVTTLFSKEFDNEDNVIFKDEALIEILQDYNQMFDRRFDFAKHDKFKKDIADRLAHKGAHKRIVKEKQLDIVIVVEQLLTGFDSKWVNALYVDKVMKHAKIIQSFSRTNRLFGSDKQFGIIRYYRKIHTMARNINDAVEMYSGQHALGLFVDKLPKNLRRFNQIFEEIGDVFCSEGINDFEKLPDDLPSRQKFAIEFKKFDDLLTAIKIQGFVWERLTYGKIDVFCNETTYQVLLLRYTELSDDTGGGVGPRHEEVPYEIDYTIIERDPVRINYEYLNSRFDLYVVAIESQDLHLTKKRRDELYKNMNKLTVEQQGYANLLIEELEDYINHGEAEGVETLITDVEKTFTELINERQTRAEGEKIHHFSMNLGLDEEMLRAIINSKPTEVTLNEYGRFDDLKGTVNKELAKVWLEQELMCELVGFKLNFEIANALRKFILEG